MHFFFFFLVEERGCDSSIQEYMVVNMTFEIMK